MRKKRISSLVITTILVLSAISLIPINEVRSTSIATLYVGGTGAGNYTTIQSAIENANDNDTVFVFSGIYYENVVINKSLTLVGENKNTTIIDGNGTGDVIYVSADWVYITQFKIQNSGGIFPNAGINIHSNYSTINHNQIVENDNIGIHLIGSGNNTISDNNFSRNDEGLSVRYSKDNVIINNTFISSVWVGFSFTDSSDNIFSNNLFFNDGISLSYSASTINAKNYNNTVSNNTVNGKPLIYLIGESDNVIIAGAGQLVLIGCDNITLQNQTLSNTPVGLQLIDTSNCLIKGVDIRDNRYGIRALYSHNNTFLDNNISYNIVGIYVYRSTDNIILDNNISHTNGRGVFLHFSSNNTIINNTVSNNNEGITLYSSSDNNLLYHNYIINNTLQAYDECSNTKWDNGYPSGGNYWSDFDELGEGAYDNYNGPNQDIPGGDGIVDGSSLNPYSIPGGNNQDRYPLIPQWNTTIIPPTCSLYGNPISGNVPLIVTFSMEAHDTDGTIASWNLDINNDGTPEYSGSGNPPSTQQHTYTNAGVYTAKLAVTDNEGETASDVGIITVNQELPENKPPTCVLTVNQTSGVVPLTVTFTITATDSDGSISSWTLDVDNDGTPEHSDSGMPPSRQQHTYLIAGTYIAKLTVIDNDGANASATVTITVTQQANQTPIADYIYSPQNPTIQGIILFIDTSTDSDGEIVNWYWDFGDGISSTVANPTHTYEEGGSYTVTLTVTDDDGDIDTYSKIITVTTDDGDGTPGFEFLPLMFSFLCLLVLAQRKRQQAYK